MNLIKNNPYRILGLLAGASAKEQQKQISKLKMYLDAEQEPEGDFSFPILGSLNRTVDAVGDAASKLNLESDKINAALFWFINGNEITDEPAFDALKDSSVLEALNIWSKLIDVNDVTNKNYSAFLNLSTYKLNIAFSNVPFVTSALQEGITLKLKFLESDLLSEFVKKIVGITYKPKKEELQKYFLTQVQFELEKTQQNTFAKFLDIITQIEFSGKEDFLKEFTQKPIQQIEKKIDDAREKRKANKAAANNVGISLFEETSDSLAQLKATLNLSNSKFVSISDKVSEEVLQCGIDYFTYFRETSTDPISASMSLFRKAKSLAVGNFAKQRCEENINNLQEWTEGKPERDKQAKVLDDLEKLKTLIDEYEGRNQTVTNGKQLLIVTRPYLNNVKSILGVGDELYLGLSSRIASDAQGMCVSEINKLQERFTNTINNSTKLAAVILLKEKVTEAWDVATTIGAMDLRQDFRVRYAQNKNSLSNLKTQLASFNTSSRSSSTSSSSGSSGCYIATMAYGDYQGKRI